MSLFSEKSLFFASSQPPWQNVLAWKMIARHHYEVHSTAGSLRIFRQFAWLEAGSGKIALPRPVRRYRQPLGVSIHSVRGVVMVKAVIFDVGGTLLGATDLFDNILAGNTSTEAHDEIYNQLGNVFFRHIADCRNGSEFKWVVEIIAIAIETVSKENDNCLSSVNPEQVYWNTFVRDSYVIHNADVALETLVDKKVDLFVASDADVELIYAQFEKHQWSNYFRQVFISSEVKAYKPNDAFVAVLDDAIRKYDKNEVIFVGDSEVDIETGKRLGVRTALIGKSNQRQYNADYSISSLLELLDL